MTDYRLYIHGVSLGHDICGSEEDRDYFDRFYNHDDDVRVSSQLRMEIVRGKMFCTYLRKKNITGAEGRPGSYFAMTLCFPDSFCKSAGTLFNLLDSIYKRIVVGSVTEQTKDGERYLVKEISKARYKDKSAVEAVKAVIDANLDKLSFDSLQGFSESKGLVAVCLKEVDSPLFFDSLKTAGALISPEYPTTGEKLTRLLGEVKPVKAENQRLNRDNDDLKEQNRIMAEDLKRLRGENERLHGEVASAAAAADRKYSAALKDKDAELAECKELLNRQERKMKKMAEDTSEVDLTMKKLAALMAGRFPVDGHEKGGPRGGRGAAGKRQNWREKLPEMILCLLAVLVVSSCLYCGLAVSRLSSSVDRIEKSMPAAVGSDTVTQDEARTDSTDAAKDSTSKASRSVTTDSKTNSK